MSQPHAPVYSIGTSKKGTLEKSDSLYTPGPGAYEPKLNKTTNPKWKIGTSIRNKMQSGIGPGPAQYTLPFYFPSGPKYSIPHKSRNASKGDISPGPGSYCPSINYGDPSYTIVTRHDDHKSDITPGPGNYNIRAEKDLIVPSARFTREKRMGLGSSDMSSNPGVGNYNLFSTSDSVLTSHPKYSFGRQKRCDDSKNQYSPGPGSYNYREFIGKEAPKVTICSKHNRGLDRSNSMGPGPAYYNMTSADIYKRKNPMFKIGTSTRTDFTQRNIGNPGVGQYSLAKCDSSRLLHNPTWKIGTSIRPPLSEIDRSVPGVGAYRLSDEFGSEAPKYTIRLKTNYGKLPNTNPGPGQYNTSNIEFRKNPSWKIGTSQRDDELKKVERNNYPGPANYKNDNGIMKRNSPNCIFGRAIRMGKEKKGADISPGPGAYKIPCKFADVNDYTRMNSNFDPKYKYV